MAEPTSLGPWPLGLDNVHDPRHRVFQLPGKNQPPARLKIATDVDLTDEGWPSTRLPATTVQTLTEGLGLWSFGDRAFYQDGANLYEIGTVDPIVTGLTRRIEFVEYGNRLLLSDGSTHKELDATTVRAWGLPVPVVTLSATAGATFPAGIYRVEVTFFDGRNEGGSSIPRLITLSSPSNIQVSVSGHDARAQSMRLYVGESNQEPNYGRTIAISGSGPQVFQAGYATVVGKPPVTRNMAGPISGLTSLATFKSFVLAGKSDTVFRSEGQQPHLFDYTRFVSFPENITESGTAPLATDAGSGWWQGTEGGLYWVFGENPQDWKPAKKTNGRVLAGCAVVPGGFFPTLQTSNPVAVYVGQTGVMICLVSGEVIPVTQDRYHVDISAYTRASFALSTRGEFRQLLVGLS